MNTDISSLLKKGLTGKEAGKLVLGDATRKITGQKVFLSQKEIKAITDSLIDREQIADYNSYFDLRNSASRCFTMFNMLAETVMKKAYLLKGVITGNRILKELTEEDGTYRKYIPYLMTEKEYKDKLELQRKEKFVKKMGLDYLILNLVYFYIREYQDAEETPYNDLFKSYEAQELTDTEVLASYKKSEEEEKLAKEEWNYFSYMTDELPYSVYHSDMKNSVKYAGEEQYKKELQDIAEKNKKKHDEPRKYDRTDLLWDIWCFYHSEDNGIDLKKFKTDYPELFSAILKDIKALQKKGLPIKENLDTLPLDKYSEIVLTYEDLYKAKLTPYVREIDYLDNVNGQEIAVIKGYHTGVDENGYNRTGQPLTMLENMLRDLLIDSVVYKKIEVEESQKGFNTFDVFEKELKQALASYTLAKLCNEQAEIELIPNEMLDSKVWETRVTIFQFNNAMLFYFDSLEEAEKHGYRPVYPDKLMPSKEKISKARSKLKDAVSLKEKGIMDLLDDLLL